MAIVDPGPRPDLPALVPPWLDRVAQWSWRLLVGVGLLALVVLVTMAVPMVVVPVILATILAATLDPLVRVLVRRGRRQGQAAAIAVGGGFLAITALMVLVFVVAGGAGRGHRAAGLERRRIGERRGGRRAGAARVRGGRPGGWRWSGRWPRSRPRWARPWWSLVLSVLLTFYFLKDGGRLWNRTLARVRPEAPGAVDEAGSRAFEVLSGYMIGTGAISLVGATSQLVIMLVLGIPLAVPIFVLSFFLCFIPYIGGFISTGIAFLVTIAVGSPQDIAIMAIWTIVFNLVTGNIVSPLVYGKTVHLHPAVVLVAIPAGSAIGGIMGMFLVVPFLGIVATVWRTVLAIIGLPRLRRATDAPAGRGRAGDAGGDRAGTRAELAGTGATGAG